MQLQNNGSVVKLFFNCENSKIKFVESSAVVDIEAISLSEYQTNASYNSLNFGNGGSGQINLSTGEFSLNRSICKTKNNALDWAISNNFNSTRKNILKIFEENNYDSHCGYGWNLNVQQFLKKYNNDNTLSFEYLDANGKSQIIEEKYYYIDSTNNKKFIKRNEICIEPDGSLFYETESIKKEVYTTLESPTGLKLISSINDIEGHELVDFEPEELANIKLQIEQLKEYINSTTSNIRNSEKQLCFLIVSKYNVLKTLKPDADTNTDSNANTNTESTSENLETTPYEKLDYESFKEISYDVLKEDNKEIYEYLFDEKIENEDNSIENTSTSQSEINDENNDCIAKQLFDELGVYYKNKTYSADLGTINQQLNSTFENIIKSSQSIGKYENQLIKLTHQQEQYELQIPVHYLYSEENIIYGFGKTFDENIFRLVYITDMYENSVVINYENLTSNKITNIVDSSNNAITFAYNENDLIEIIKTSDENEIVLKYDSNNRLKFIKNKDKIICRYSYDVNNNIISVLDNSGIGCSLSYNSYGQAIKVQKFSLLESVNENIKFKDNLTLEFEDNFNYFPYLIENDYIDFEYYNFKTTKVRNKTKTITYIFNRLGQVVHLYEEDSSKEVPDKCMNSKEFKYSQGMRSETISILPYSHDYLNTSSKLYLSEDNFFVSSYDMSIPSLVPTGVNCFDITANPNGTNIKEYIVNQENIAKINVEKIKNLVLVGWAKANSAFVKDNNIREYFSYAGSEEEINYPNYVNDRKFELRASIKYKNETSPVILTKQFDWMNDQWQCNSLSIKLEDKEIESISCFVDYSYNTNKIEFIDLDLHEGAWELKNYNDEKLLTSLETNISKSIYEYNTNHNLVKEQLIYNNSSYITTYDYNKNNKLIRKTSYDGSVVENIYNDKGIVIRTETYHKDDPTSKFVNESILDEKGNENSSINELGEKISNFEYFQNTNLVSSETDCYGNKTAYGYNNDKNLVAMSSTINNEENTNIYGYTLSFLTKLSHNNFDINFEYDSQGRQSKILVAGQEYLSKTYSENEETSTFIPSNEKFKQIFDNNGNLLETYYNDVLLAKNEYDHYGKVTKTTDYSNDETKSTSYAFDKYGKATGKTSEQHSVQLTFDDLYDENDNIKSSTITIGDKSLNYSFDYNQDLESKLNNVTLKYGNNKIFEQNISYDKLGRTSKVTFNNKVKQYHYLKSGDHCSNLVSSVWYGEDNKIKDNVKYKYDNKGNIIEIRENGVLINRYQYDGLSRIIREDNKDLNKTFTYSYDAGGNITSKKGYAFTLQSVEEIEPKNVDNYAYSATGWKDQLLSYNGEVISYDALGNPEEYRGKTFNWSHGRQLDEIEGVATYKYNANGIRISKTVIGTDEAITTKFYLNNNKILAQDDGNLLYFHYDVDGIAGFTWQASESISYNYTYKKNLQGDITGIYEKIVTDDKEENKLIVKYAYDAWGNHSCKVLTKDDKYIDINETIDYTKYEGLSIEDIEIYAKVLEDRKNTAKINPFRYRGYYYDIETGLYYLNSRYYDPETGRFINADDISILSTLSQDLNGLNLYAYCFNNPVNDIDENGCWSWKKFWKVVGAVAIVVATTALVVATAGIALGILGASAAVTTAVLAGATIGGLTVGFGEIISQSLTNGIDNLDYDTIFIQTLTSSSIGALSGLAGHSASSIIRTTARIGIISINGLSSIVQGIHNGNSFEQILISTISSVVFASIFQIKGFKGDMLLNNTVAQNIFLSYRNLGRLLLKITFGRVTNSLISHLKRNFN